MTTSPTPTARPAPSPATTTQATTTPATTRPAAAGTALAAAAALVVKGRAPQTGYTRQAFGQAWADVNRNGCDTRNDILRRDLDPVTVQSGTHGCKVLTGVLADPYTGTVIHFTRGAGTSSAVQIDHVVALDDAWQKGAQQWSAATREAFANDPLNLFAVDGATNQGKGAGDAATWLPPNTSFRCAYVARQASVKKSYRVWVTAAERTAMLRVLARCPQQPLVSRAAATRAKASTAATRPPTTPTPAPTTRPTRPAPRTQPVPSPPASSPPAPVYYQNCDAVRAAGKAPLYRNDPGYRPQLDRDGDGVACE